ncbi:uncharacterized protein PG998_010264 [Apiospora kogelbergensis]|uniref:uncharacterized protein n=1 Tax=Apiospora kogelbergensis TaxID=1337665 RepID=UPI00312EA0EC
MSPSRAVGEHARCLRYRNFRPPVSTIDVATDTLVWTEQVVVTYVRGTPTTYTREVYGSVTANWPDPSLPPTALTTDKSTPNLSSTAKSGSTAFVQLNCLKYGISDNKPIFYELGIDLSGNGYSIFDSVLQLEIAACI